MDVQHANGSLELSLQRQMNEYFSPEPQNQSGGADAPLIESQIPSGKSYTREFYLNCGRTLDNPKDRRLGINLLRLAASRFANDFQILWCLARLLAKEGLLSEEVKIREFLYKATFSFEACVALGFCLYRMKEHESSLAYLLESLSLQREDSAITFEIFKRIGTCSLHVKDVEGAEEYFHKALRLNRRDADLFVRLGTMEFQRENHHKSLEHFEQALLLDRKCEKAWVGIGMNHLKFGDYDLGVANLKMALDINPLNRTAVHLLCAWGRNIVKKSELNRTLVRYLADFHDDSEMSLLLVQGLCEEKNTQLAFLESVKSLVFHTQNKEWGQIYDALWSQQCSTTS